MITRLEPERCCGCSACYNICPKQCISMQADEEGFLFPVIDSARCIQCNLCERVCPALNPPQWEEKKVLAAVARNRDREILDTSSSGGFFMALSRYAVLHNGTVYGAALDGDMCVKHKRAVDFEECLKFMGSKYVQSQIGDIFSQVKKDLGNGMPVVFSGTPCQVEGLRSFLGREYSNLILVDFACHGVPSPALWDRFLKIQQEKYGSPVIKAQFCSKNLGYHSRSMRLVFANGEIYSASGRIDIFYKCFFKDVALRKSCYQCPFKRVNRNSDFTLYDSWHAGRVLNITDDDKGYTNVLVHSEKGNQILKELESQLEIYPVELSQILPRNGGNVLHSAPKPSCRDVFYSEMNSVGLKKTVQKYFPIKGKDYVIEQIKPILKKLHILPLLSVMKRRKRRR